MLVVRVLPGICTATLAFSPALFSLSFPISLSLSLFPFCLTLGFSLSLFRSLTNGRGGLAESRGDKDRSSTENRKWDFRRELHAISRDIRSEGGPPRKGLPRKLRVVLVARRGLYD